MSWPANWDLQIDPVVFKTLKRLPRHDVEAILNVIKLLPLNPYFGDIQKMKGETIFKISGQQLDKKYLQEWAKRLGVDKFLDDYGK